MFRIAALLLLLACCIAPMRGAQAQIRHCVTADGTRLYTDRKCEDLGASEYRAPPTPAAGTGDARQNVCARSVQDLAYALDDAVRAGDTNRIAALYDWTGMGTASGYRLMDRLATIAQRPLVTVQPAYADDTDDDMAGSAGRIGAMTGLPARSPRLVGLRVEQTLANGSTPTHTLFGLRRRLGCWWLHL